MPQRSLSEMFTYSTVKIECEDINKKKSTGTGFIIEINDNDKSIPLLITNKHVVENAIKTTLEFCKSDENGEPIDTEKVDIVIDGQSDEYWFAHPESSVDLCCLFFSNILNELGEKRIIYCPIDISYIPTEDELKSYSAMEDIVMIGYPLGFMDSYNHKPIIRHGITATHLKNNYQGKKEFLADIPSYPGSSGSPIFILDEGYHRGNEGIILSSRVKLVGILYSYQYYDEKGHIEFANIENCLQTTIKMPTNLGIAIKSQRLLDFKTVLIHKGLNFSS